MKTIWKELHIEKALPLKHQASGATLYCAADLDALSLHLQALPLLNKPSIKTTLTAGQKQLFYKQKRIGGLRKRLKLSYSNSYASRSRPFMEIKNNLAIHELDLSGKLQAVIIYRELGLIRSIAILTDYLSRHQSLNDYLEDHPNEVQETILKSLTLLKDLQQSGVAHLDFWLGNLMIDNYDGTLCAIDHEYTFRGSISRPNETLGFQLGFFYFNTLQTWLDETTYKALVKQIFPFAFDEHASNTLYEKCREEQEHSSVRLKLLASLTC